MSQWLAIKHISEARVFVLLGIMSSKKTEDKAATSQKKITRRQMLRGAGIITSAPATPDASDTGTFRGAVRYPWGTVKDALVKAGEKSTVSDSAGGYEIAGLAPGKYLVTAEAPFPGYNAMPKSVEVAAGETKTVDIDFDFKKTVVEGQVYGKEEKPIVGAVISGVLTGRDPAKAVTDEKGHFTIDTASPGAQFIRVNALGHMGETRDFTAPEAATTTLEFHLAQATCKVHGMVTDKNGQPLRAEVFLSKGGIITQRTWTDAKTGYYEFPVLPSTYDILANAADYLSEGWRGEVSADTKVDLSLGIAPPPQPTAA
jgi:hypothetical protein